MLLERFHRPVRGVRIVDKGPVDENGGQCVQIIPLRQLNRRDLDRLLDQLGPQNDLLVTSALSARERKVFEEFGFGERESLHLLRHDLESVTSVPTPSGLKLRPGRRSDIDKVLKIDRGSFDSFWTLDREGLQAARKATPVHRYTIATIDSEVVGYAVTGRSVKSSFLQRLGVDSSVRRGGIGSQLVIDALRWAKAENATSMLVNTQDSNDAAVQLYKWCGFELLPETLKVLERPTDQSAA